MTTTSPPPSSSGRTVPDASPRNWVDRIAPAPWRPYLRLARFDRPIGAWLLLFPCWWGQALAELSVGHPYPKPWYLALFLVGAFLMRGAGCTYNDIVDKDYDARVARTAARPIPSGQVSVAEARMFLVVLCIAGFVILIQLNLFTIALGASSLVLVAIYPFMKRFTYWPQIVLGLTFKWGALVGWSAVTGSLSPTPIALYAGCVLWTIGYDTIYAHQDKEDDLLVGLKSTALDWARRRRDGWQRSTRVPSCCGDWPVRWPARGSRFFWRSPWRRSSSPGRWRPSTWPIRPIAWPASSPIGWSAGRCSSGWLPTWRSSPSPTPTIEAAHRRARASRSAAKPASYRCRHACIQVSANS